VIVFSKVRRWLDGVTSKLQEVIAPSSSNSTAEDSVSSVAVDARGYSATRSACSPSQSLSLNKLDSGLSEHLLELAQSVLSEKQKFLLVCASEELRYDSMTLTRLCERLCRELRMSYSTVKWNIKRLKVLKLLYGGSENSKGTHAQLTPLGQLITSMLTQDGNASPNEAAKEVELT
jgi:hypothetical protein